MLLPARAAFNDLIDHLLRSESRFGLRATITTTGGDADESDNVKTRQWGSWLHMAPNAQVALEFTVAVARSVRAARVRLDLLRVPIGTGVAGPDESLVLRTGHHIIPVSLNTPEQLPHGSVFAARLTLTDSAAGTVLQQHERTVAYDTVPPFLTSYRAILLRDGRLAVQVQAGDRHAGMPHNGVATEYSLDGGHTWSRQVHDAVEDDFGRASLFETVLGPFPHGADLLVGISASDNVGNLNVRLPDDAGVFVAPHNAELLLDVDRAAVDGNPLFATGAAARRAAWVAASDTTIAQLLSDRTARDLNARERFEIRRLAELRSFRIC